MELSRCLLRRTSVMAGFGRTETIRTVGSSAAFVELTSRRYPGLQRGHFASLTDADAANIERLVSGRVLTDLSELEGYNMDWMKTLRGKTHLRERIQTRRHTARVNHLHLRQLESLCRLLERYFSRFTLYVVCCDSHLLVRSDSIQHQNNV